MSIGVYINDGPTLEAEYARALEQPKSCLKCGSGEKHAPYWCGMGVEAYVICRRVPGCPKMQPFDWCEQFSEGPKGIAHG